MSQRCTCGQPLHVGSILASEIDRVGRYEAILIHIGPPPPAPQIQALTLVSLTEELFWQHTGDLLTWQAGVGTPVRCGTAKDIPPPCSGGAPACHASRQNRLVWQRANTPELMTS